MHRWLNRLLLLFMASVLALLLAELLVRVRHDDWRLLDRLMPVLADEQSLHIPSPDPRRLITLKPHARFEGHAAYGPYTVSINGLGFRGPEPRIPKPSGTFRIVAIGGSNVYGAGINDDQTWPAQLEKALNQQQHGRFEVLNLGVAGYNPLQMIATAEEAIATLEPDLILYCFSNHGPRFALPGLTPLESAFTADPSLWREQLPPHYFDPKQVSGVALRWFLLQHSALFRFWVVQRLAQRPGPRVMTPEAYEPQYIEQTLSFLDEYRKRVPFFIFLCPGIEPSRFYPYHASLGLPYFLLSSTNLPEVYQRIHAPPYVYTWYAEQLVVQLKHWKLLPADALVASPG
ncbi:MAG: SGNH/GDSL hydrolase family protein [Myxococcota bacterium]